MADPPLLLAGKLNVSPSMFIKPLHESQALKLITRRQLAERWQCSVPTIKRREKSGAFPVTNLGGGMARYDVADIEAYEAQTKVRRA